MGINDSLKVNTTGGKMLLKDGEHSARFSEHIPPMLTCCRTETTYSGGCAGSTTMESFVFSSMMLPDCYNCNFASETLIDCSQVCIIVVGPSP